MSAGVETGPKTPNERWKRLGRKASKLGISLTSVGILGTLGLLARDESNFTTEHGFRVGIETMWSQDTVFKTPVGDAILPEIHAGPFAPRIRINGISVDRAIKLLNDADRLGRLPTELQEDLSQIPQKVRDHAIFDLKLLAGLSFAGWAVAETITRTGKSSTRKLSFAVMRSFLAATIATGALAASDLAAYRAVNLDNLKVSEDLSIVADSTRVYSDLDKHDESVANEIAETIEGYRKLQAAVELLGEEKEEPETCVMVVSDIHSRNVSSLLKTFIESSCVDIIIDAGDLTERGLSFEDDFFANPRALQQWRGIKTSLVQLGVPYLIVKGNHDSTTIMEAVDEIPNITVLNNETQNISGLTIAGIADPRDPSGNYTEEEDNLMNEASGIVLQELIDETRPDIAVVHNPDAVPDVRGVSLVITGHTHVCQAVVEKLESGTIHYNQGTTGGAGLRTLQENDCGEEQPQTVSIIYFNSEAKPYAVDEFTITSLDGTLALTANERSIP